MTRRGERRGRRVFATMGLLVGSTLLVSGSFAGEGAAGDGGHALPADYWHLPLAPQGAAPGEWSEVERALDPESCGACHADRYEEWRTSVHARAFSPGLVGQLLTFDARAAAECMKCHAPLFEQREAFERARERGEAHLRAAQGLAAAGNACAGCHLRGHRRFGPPARESGATGASDPENPHGGVNRTADFEKADFCAACHQFPQAYAVNGKPLENTVAEWRASPQAARGITCQTCHMPDRRHLWRGIHDPEMVEAGLTARFRADREAARFELTNTGVGHAFPTYVTPKAVMRAVALDEAGEPRAGTEVAYTIQRVVRFAGGRWAELSDTRLLPGETATLTVPWRGSDRVRLWLEVNPDDFYDREVFAGLLRSLPSGSEAQRLIALADEEAGESRYRLFETELARPRDEGAGKAPAGREPTGKAAPRREPRAR